MTVKAEGYLYCTFIDNFLSVPGWRSRQILTQDFFSCSTQLLHYYLLSRNQVKNQYFSKILKGTGWIFRWFLNHENSYPAKFFWCKKCLESQYRSSSMRENLWAESRELRDSAAQLWNRIFSQFSRFTTIPVRKCI